MMSPDLNDAMAEIEATHEWAHTIIGDQIERLEADKVRLEGELAETKTFWEKQSERSIELQQELRTIAETEQQRADQLEAVFHRDKTGEACDVVKGITHDIGEAISSGKVPDGLKKYKYLREICQQAIEQALGEKGNE